MKGNEIVKKFVEQRRKLLVRGEAVRATVESGPCARHRVSERNDISPCVDNRTMNLK